MQPPAPIASLSILLAATLPLAGCAADGPYPSLAPRAIERQQADPEPVAVEVAADPALAAAVAELLGRARSGEAAFASEIAAAERAVAGAGASGSEGWVEAQQALSLAQAARGPTVSALSDLDALAMERAKQATAASDQARIEQAIDEVQQLADGQSRRLEALRARLSSG
jgi:hypothetical protein